VQTVDFFTPIVDDPIGFGMIAAANALSDVYAMGGTPLTALNITCFPEKGDIGLEVLEKILLGGYQKATEAGVAIIGGHTVDDREPKYGMAVTGVVKPGEMFSHHGARPGDLLLLTKPLGTGVLATALKAGSAPEGTEALLIETCAALNDRAAGVARRVGAGAVTDVTGFGLVNHAANLLEASGVGAEIWVDELPVLPGVDSCMEAGRIPGGTRKNLAFAEKGPMRIEDGVGENQALLANDAQTSGGLLMTVDPERIDEARASLAADGAPVAAVIGRITGDAGRLVLRPHR
jgi:selenide,water dikinase